MSRIEVGVIGDVHGGAHLKYPADYPTPEQWEGYYAEIREEVLRGQINLILLLGDYTHDGKPEELDPTIEFVSSLPIAKIGILGNHDYRGNNHDNITKRLQAAGVTMIDQEAVELDINGEHIAVYGFSGYIGTEEEARIKAILDPEERLREHRRATEQFIPKLTHDLADLQARGVPTIVMMHYSPIGATVDKTLDPFASPDMSPAVLNTIDSFNNVQFIVHGHTHGGKDAYGGEPKGITPKGKPVFNAAAPLLLRLGVKPPIVRRNI